MSTIKVHTICGIKRSLLDRTFRALQKLRTRINEYGHVLWRWRADSMYAEQDGFGGS